MALVDRFSGRFVDFRITPKGEATSRRLPGKVFGVYVALALGCILPVLLVSDVSEARGFYLLSVINALIYTAIVLVIVFHHRRESGASIRADWRNAIVQYGAALSVAVLAGFALYLRAPESVAALAYGLEPLHLTRVEYVVSGAGIQKDAGSVRFSFDLWWD